MLQSTGSHRVRHNLATEQEGKMANAKAYARDQGLGKAQEHRVGRGDEGKRRCGGRTVVQSLRGAGGGCVEPETGKKPHSAESTNTHVWGWQVY